MIGVESNRSGAAIGFLDRESANQVLRAIVDAVLVVGLDGRITATNAGANRLLGYRGCELVGEPLACVFADDGSAIATTRLQLVQVGNNLRTTEVNLRARDGAVIPATVSGSAVTDSDGIPKGIVLVAHDLRELRELSRIAELERRTGELRRSIIARAIAAQEEERQRIARELHDESGQSLTSLLAGLQRLAEHSESPEVREQVRELQVTAERTLRELGRIARGLRPSVLDDVGLLPALNRLVREFSRAHGIPTELIATGFDGRFDPEIETAIYRMVQEALTNIAKHAEATRVSATLQALDDQLVVTIEDDGRGFEASEDTNGAISLEGGLGLASLRERAHLLDGGMAVESSPGEGATLYFRLPLRRGGQS